MRDNKSLILNITSIEDVDKITSSTKYINLDISNFNKGVIEYFKKNGQGLMFSERINNNNGYIYVDYNNFFNAEVIIEKIIKGINDSFSEIEKVKYLYIEVGKILGLDINVMSDKTDSFDFSKFSIINNIWGSIYNRRATNISIVKVIYYFCSIIKIDCDIINTNNIGHLKNKILINNNYLIVDLTKDLPFIQGIFKTRFFAAFNDDIELDKKIGYVKDDYNENKLDSALKKANYDSEFFLKEILLITQGILGIGSIKQFELGYIYRFIFDKYCPNYDIIINNLYINNINMREHFILISYNKEHYGFNYRSNTFVLVTDDNIIENIEKNKIGIYLNEDIPNIGFRRKEVV